MHTSFLRLSTAVAFSFATLVAAPAYAAAGPTITDASFEAANLGASGYQYGPGTVGGSSFNSKAGVAGAYSPFVDMVGTVPTDGFQVAFIQSVEGDEGSFTMSLSNLTIGSTYDFMFDAAKRGGFGVVRELSVFYGALGLGTFSATTTAFQTFTTASFVALGDSGTLTFTAGASRTGDDNVLIDNVRINERDAAPGDVSAVPEPATWAMMIVGFGAVGVASRRRRHTMSRLAQIA